MSASAECLTINTHHPSCRALRGATFLHSDNNNGSMSVFFCSVRQSGQKSTFNC